MVIVFSVRDNASYPPGERKTGLTPTWLFFKQLSDASNIAPPAIREMGGGMYAFDYDPIANHEAVGQIDAGDTLVNSSDRYVDVAITRDVSQVDLTQPVPLVNSAHTLGDALNAARAQGFGKWTCEGTALTLYAADGVTPVRSFTLDDPDAPHSRT
jgi:hypothetical protein